MFVRPFVSLSSIGHMEQDVDIAHSQPTAPPRRRAPPSVSEGAQLHRLVLRRAMGEIVTSCHDTHIPGVWLWYPGDSGPGERSLGREETGLPRAPLRVSACGVRGELRAPMELLLPFHSGILAACIVSPTDHPHPQREGCSECLPIPSPVRGVSQCPAFGGPSIALVISTAVARVR